MMIGLNAEEVGAALLTSDGRHVHMTFADTTGDKIILRLPVTEIGNLVVELLLAGRSALLEGQHSRRVIYAETVGAQETTEPGMIDLTVRLPGGLHLTFRLPDDEAPPAPPE